MKTNSFINSPIIQTLVYANVFVAICSLAQVVLTYQLFSIPYNYVNNSYLLFIFLSTYLQYNMQRGYMINENNSQTPRSVWLIKHKKILLYSVGISLITVMFLCNNLSWTSIAIMIGAEIISTIYYLPPFNLRKHGYIKPFLISLIWVISCSAVPLIENHLMNLQNSTFLLGQFLLLSVLCLLFDIKDAELDLKSGINTYANKLGITATRLICVLLAMIAAFAFYLFSADSINYIKLLAFITLVISTVFYTTKNRHSFYYYLWIDGLLIIETIFFIL